MSSFQSDIRCSDGHDIRRHRFNCGASLDGKVQTVSCRRCGVLLGSRLTRDPKERETL